MDRVEMLPLSRRSSLEKLSLLWTAFSKRNQDRCFLLKVRKEVIEATVSEITTGSSVQIPMETQRRYILPRRWGSLRNHRGNNVQNVRRVRSVQFSTVQCKTLAIRTRSGKPIKYEHHPISFQKNVSNSCRWNRSDSSVSDTDTDRYIDSWFLTPSQPWRLYQGEPLI